MNFEFLTEYAVPVIVGICLLLGVILKRWIKDLDNKFIPTILAVVGVFLAVWINDWSITPEILLQGLFSGLGATGAHQVYKQVKGDE